MLQRAGAARRRAPPELVDLLTEADFPTNEIKRRLSDLTRERDGLRVQLAEAETRATARQAAGGRLQSIEAWARKASRKLDQLDDAGRQAAPQAFVEEITVTPDRGLHIQGLLLVEDAVQYGHSRKQSRTPGRRTAR